MNDSAILFGDSPLNAQGLAEVIDDTAGNNCVVFAGANGADLLKELKGSASHSFWSHHAPSPTH